MGYRNKLHHRQQIFFQLDDYIFALFNKGLFWDSMCISPIIFVP